MNGSRLRLGTAQAIPPITKTSEQRAKADEELPWDQPAANASGSQARGAIETAVSNAPVNAAAEPEEYLEAVEERTQAGTRTAESAIQVSPHAAPMLRSPVKPACVGRTEGRGPRGENVPEAAMRFMGWVQEGLASGELRFNESGALVHFVQEGMLLVSPRIFRKFAQVHGDDGRGPIEIGDEALLGKGVQRQLLRAGWYVRAEKGVNILAYQVVRGGRTISQLCGVVIEEPGRFVKPVPPSNPVLLRAAPIPRKSAS